MHIGALLRGARQPVATCAKLFPVAVSPAVNEMSSSADRISFRALSTQQSSGRAREFHECIPRVYCKR